MLNQIAMLAHPGGSCLIQGRLEMAERDVEPEALVATPERDLLQVLGYSNPGAACVIGLHLV